MNDLEVLKGARKLIADAPKLLKKSYNNNDIKNGKPPNCFCLLGAIAHAYSKGNLSCLNSSEENYYAGILGFKNGVIAFEWNDDPKRRKRDVLKLLDQTITRLEDHKDYLAEVEKL